ncbi:MAG: HAMP domain-containing histidine kinase [Tannerella sp.]|jgi:two-component system phosphate regulon sensor histidine kinase PhoR|nr:HAMP domain-containing histidine kinase [Tannerella sp.]
MKKSIIWLLAVVMGFAFGGLLYLQVNYISIILKTSNEQFDTTVKRCLEQVSNTLERDEARKYMEEDMNYFKYKNAPKRQDLNQTITTESRQLQIQDSNGVIQRLEMSHSGVNPKGANMPSKDAIIKESEEYQRNLWKRYQHQAGLLEDVLYNMLYTAHLKPIEKRLDFKILNNYLKTELVNNGLNLPYIFVVIDKDNQIVYQNEAFKPAKIVDVLTVVLFPNDPPSKRNYLKIYFPTKSDYISSSVTFLVPSVIFSFILLTTFIFTIYAIFRQKKLSEMKNDFVNNMTHELKTPVSTISLATQMLKDTDISKNPDVFKHIYGVISDETKRLSFLVEKVLQISLFEKQRALLKLKELDANDLLAGVASTFALKVEKYGGTIDVDMQAENSAIYADEMHLTNVLFNLMDNAVKYRRQDAPLQLMARTRNENGKLYLSIEDNGIGIKKEHLKKVFDRFYRIPTGNVHDVKGFGLGLAYVRKIVEDHGGSIRAEQQDDGIIGTKFIITLPLIKNK